MANEIDNYILTFEPDIQKKLNEMRAIIQSAAKAAEEKISYGMPSYALNGMLVYFAGYKKHIGFYPMPSAINSFKKDLEIYKTSKGAIQFPLDKPFPKKLITAIVKFRVKENLASPYGKKKNKS